jgi:hypothetical protein
VSRARQVGLASAAAIGLLTLGAQQARATARAWTGASSSSWNNAANWSPAGIPSASDDVTIAGGSATINIDAAIDVRSISISGACTRTIRAFPAATPIRVRGDLTLSSTSSGGVLRLSTGTTQIGGQLARSNDNMSLDTNGGVIVFNAASGSKTHTFSGATVDSVIINDGLVGYWNFDEPASPFADRSGYANDAVLSGAYAAARPPTTLFTDASAVELNGTSNYMTLGATNLPNTSAPQTIAAWVKFSGATTAQAIVALTGSGGAIRMGLASGYLLVRKNNGATLVQTAAPSTNTWHHVAYTVSGTTQVLYVDGVATTATATPDNATPTSAYAGATAPATERLAGALDELRIYNRALTAAEVLALAQGRLPATGSAIHTFSDAFANATSYSQFIIASGIVTGSAAIVARGDWLNYGGRFTGTGTVTLAAASARKLLSGGQPFRNLTINASGSYTLADRLWIAQVPGIANSGVLAVVKAGGLDGGGYVIHAGKLDDQTGSGGGFLSTTDGTLVLDGTASYALASKYFCGLRIEDPSEAGLVGYWKLDQGQGSSVRDSVATNEGTVSATGAGWTASAPPTVSFDNPAAMSFTATASGYVSAGAAGLPAANAAQTISLWANFSSSGWLQSMVALGATGSAIRLGLGGGNVQVRTSAGAILAQVTAPSAGNWHHVAYVHDPSQATPANRDKLYIDGAVSTGTGAPHDSATPTATFIGASSASADHYTGSLDDVRVYNAALTAAQVTSLSLGRYAGTGGIATLTLAGGDTTIPSSSNSGCNGGQGYGLMLDSGNLYTSTLKLTVRLTSSPVLVNAGTLHIGSNVFNGDGGLTVNPMGTLLMDEAAGQLQPGANSTVTIDGTLIASNAGAIIQRDNNGERYGFTVGSFAGARPVLNITGLAIRDTDANGLRINAALGAMTTFTRFDNVTFRRGLGTFLSISSAASLYLSSNGLSFGVGDNSNALPANNVVVTGRGVGETRVILGGATCATNKTTSSYCQNAWKLDDDADGDGVPDHPATNGAVVQYVRSAMADTAGAVEGLPTAAFDWNTFGYYSTYVAFHDAAGTADRIYVRSQTGAAEYSWDTGSGENIVGTPRWMTIGSKHVLYVATEAGKVYRLVDDGSSLTLDSSAGWADTNNPFDCGCTIVTPLAVDSSNLYWGGTTQMPTTQKVWTLGQTSRAQPVGSPMTITPVITSASPALWTSGPATYLFMGVAGNIIKVNVTNQTLDATNTNLGTASVYGRIGLGSSRVFAGADSGDLWAIDANNFTSTNRLWRYAVTGDSIKSSPYYDSSTAVVHFGTERGKMAAVNSGGVPLTGYPFVAGSTSDAIRAAPLYRNGILVFGTTTGRLYFYDRNNGSTGPALIKEYNFGPAQVVSGIGYDSSVGRYMVTTADPASNDGRIYYFDDVTDPTSPK